MLKPAARIGDMHLCPQSTPGTPPLPHVGGPIMPSGTPSILIRGRPAATMGDLALCSGCPGVLDSITQGSAKVFFNGKPAARLGDGTAHGGKITAGCPDVLLG